MSRILVVEDEEGLGAALEYQLGRRGYEVDRATDGAEGLRRFEAHGADLIVLDLMLPGLSGEDLCRAIRRRSTVPIIMLTAKDEEVDKVVGLELGADDYVTKPFSTVELIARIKAVLRRATDSRVGPDEVLVAGDVRLDLGRFEVTLAGQPVHLARKEFELLALLMANAGRVMLRDVLIDRVWGADYFGDTRTLDVHVKRLRAKIERDPHDPIHLVTVRGVGYRFVP